MGATTDSTDDPTSGTAAADEPLGENAAALLAAEHWSLLASRSLIWSEAQSRATVFLTVLSATAPATTTTSGACSPRTWWSATPSVRCGCTS